MRDYCISCWNAIIYFSKCATYIFFYSPVCATHIQLYIVCVRKHFVDICTINRGKNWFAVPVFIADVCLDFLYVHEFFRLHIKKLSQIGYWYWHETVNKYRWKCTYLSKLLSDKAVQCHIYIWAYYKFVHGYMKYVHSGFWLWCVEGMKWKWNASVLGHYFCTMKTELGLGQLGLMRWNFYEACPCVEEQAIYIIRGPLT